MDIAIYVLHFACAQPRSSQVLCMTVTPGFGGQPFQEGVLAKVSQLRALFPSLNIQVSLVVGVLGDDVCEMFLF